MRDTGAFVAVVGPSGAGKDTLIARARSVLDRREGDRRPVDFVRRTVTRASDEAAEDHASLCEAEFAAAERDGLFSLTWRAHGLCYGLPASVDETIAAGGVAVANVSRAVIPLLRERYNRVVVVNVTAPKALLAARLAARGRETAAEIKARLERSAEGEQVPGSVVDIDNSGTIEAGAARLAAVIRQILDPAAEHLDA